MSDTITNRVAKSPIITLDLADYYANGKRHELDISQWLFDGIILKEKDFRASLKSADWSLYENSFVALCCSTDAIVPAWAYMLISTYLNPIAKKVVVGSLKELELILFEEAINELEVSEYANKPIIVKGCSDLHIPETAYISLINKLQPIVKSLMFGEACSAVPLFKPKK